jgi:signal transduction histidine kinase
VQWVASYHTALLFGWQLTAIFEISIFIFALYFFIVFSTGKDIGRIAKWALALPFLFVALLTPTNMNIAEYDIYNCEGVVGSLWTLMYYVLEPLAILAIIFLGILFSFRMKAGIKKKRMILMTIGVTAFLFIFYLSNVAGELTKTYETNLIGPLGLVVFLLLLGYQMVKFKTFNLRLITTEIFISILILLLFGLLFIQNIRSVHAVSLASTFITLIIGYLMIKSARREIKQKEEIEKLANDLKKANARLKILDKMKSEFVSIASHQLRSPLTAIRGYASMLTEGSYGKLPKKATEAIEHISDSSRFMALSVEDYLNVSRIEAGNMRYEVTDFNLKDITEKIVDEMRPAALKKGLLMIFRSDCDGGCFVHADIGKTRQIIMNLIDNSMKYTPKGSITVIAHDNVKKKKMYVTIKDTGVGMSRETLDDVFNKFIRAKNANNVNVTGTGLGLFVAKKMADEMGGSVWGESEGENKGSLFHLELPLLPGKSRR